MSIDHGCCGPLLAVSSGVSLNDSDSRDHPDVDRQSEADSGRMEDWVPFPLGRNQIQSAAVGCASVPASTRLARLTGREMDVLASIADGLSNEAIARRAHISVKTLEAIS